MKKLFLASVACLFSILSFAQQVKISGNISNAGTASISFTTHWLVLPDEAKTIAKVNLDDKGNFSVTLDLSEPMPLSMTLNLTTAKLYVHPGDSIYLTADAKVFEATLKYAGRGADANNYLAKSMLNFGNSDNAFSTMIEKSKMNKDKFYKSLDSLLTEQRKFQKAQQAKNLSKPFTDYADAEYTYFNTKAKSVFNAQLAAETKTAMQNDWSIYDKVKLNNEAAIQSEEYTQTVFIYYNYKAKADYLKTHDSITTLEDYKAIAKAEYALLKTELTGKVRDYFAAKFVKAIKTYLPDSALVNEMIADYKTININKEFLIQIQAKEKSQQELQAEQRQKMQEQANAQKLTMVGKPAPAFKFADMSGKEYSLSDFKGKVVYLDAWASWCGPCKQQIPAAKELEEKFKGKDVVFLGVSIDANEEAWKKVMKEMTPAGIHVLAKGDNGAFSRNYGIMTIPRYYLIDRQGNIADADAKRPSMGVEADLDALLKK